MNISTAKLAGRAGWLFVFKQVCRTRQEDGANNKQLTTTTITNQHSFVYFLSSPARYIITMSSSASRIEYSEKYADDNNEYRYVVDLVCCDLGVFFVSIVLVTLFLVETVPSLTPPCCLALFAGT